MKIFSPLLNRNSRHNFDFFGDFRETRHLNNLKRFYFMKIQNNWSNFKNVPILQAWLYEGLPLPYRRVCYYKDSFTPYRGHQVKNFGCSLGRWINWLHCFNFARLLKNCINLSNMFILLQKQNMHASEFD